MLGSCVRLLFVFSCSALLGACATPSRFPSNEQLETLSRTPGEARILAGPVVEPESWVLQGPLPDRVSDAAVQPRSPWEDVLLRSAGHGLVLTEGLRCFAREYARFYLERRARPGEVLIAYMRGACAATGAVGSPGIVFGEVNAEHTDEMLLALWRGSLQSMVAPASREPLGGIAFARDDGYAVIAVIQAERPAIVEAFSPVPNERDRIVIRGRLQRPVERVFASVNHGPYGYEDCVLDPGVMLPAFAVACPLDADDARAWLSIGYLAPGRLLGEAVIDVLVRRPDTDMLAYQRRTGSREALVGDSAEFREDALEAVNRLRDDAGLRELALQDVQSDMAASLAPRYFAVRAGEGPPEEGDVIALGLMAGWDVEGTIRDANITGGLVSETRDVGRWLAALIESPFGRSSVLDAEVSAIAIGPVIEEDFAGSGAPVIGAVVTTYALFDDAELASLQDRISERLAAEREALGYAPQQRLNALDADARGAALRLSDGKGTPITALSSLIRVGADVLGRPLQGYVVEMNDLSLLEFPDELLGKRPPKVSITLTRYQPDGEPWGRYVVFFVTAGPRPMA